MLCLCDESEGEMKERGNADLICCVCDVCVCV